MKLDFKALTLLATLAAGWANAQGSDEPTPGATIDSLLAVVRERNPDFAAMRHEVTAAS